VPPDDSNTGPLGVPCVADFAFRMRQMLYGWGSVALVYFAVGSLDVTPLTIPEVWLDRQLPFTEHAVWIYLSFFVLVPYTYFTIVPWRLVQLRVAMQISAVISGLFFVLLPTSLNYPPFDQQGISAQMLALLVTVDSPNNCFPSLHASLTTLCVVLNIDRESIILLRRHLTIDVAGGLIVGLLAWLATHCFRMNRSAR